MNNGSRAPCLVLLVALATAAHAQPKLPPNVTPPLVVHHHEANYPVAQLAQRKHAEVELVVTIDVEGHVSNVEVRKSGGPEFDHAATTAMRLWTFKPAQRDGKNIAAKIKVPFHFSPPEPPEPENIMEPGVSGIVATPVDPKAHEHGPIHKSQDHARPLRAQPAKRDAIEETPEDVHIYGRSHVPSRGGGDHEIPPGKLALLPNDAARLLRLAPGVFLSNHGGMGHPYQIYLRGFDAREGQDLEFTVDGIPINEVGNPHGNGLVDTHFIIPELVQSLRVIEGPFAPQQGNFAVAGSALYDLGIKDPGFTAKTTFGSFGTKRLLLLWRPAGTTDHTFAGGELFSADGFGQNRASNRATTMGGYEGRLGKAGSYRLLATSYATHYAQAGVLREDDVVAGRKGFYDTYDTQQGGDATRHSLGVTLNGREGATKLSQSAFLIYRDFRLRDNFTGFQNDTVQTWQSAHAQRGDLIDQRSQTITIGGRGSARQPWTMFGKKHEIEFGYYARFDSVQGQQQRNRSGTNVPYRTDLNLSSALTNIGLYADANVHPLSWITLRGGVRGDLYHYRVTNHCALNTQSSFGSDPIDTDCFSSDRQGARSPDQTTSTSSTAVQPRTTLILGPFRGVTFSGSAGLGSRSLDPQYVNQDLKTPFASATSGEAGVAYLRSIGDVDVTVRSMLFQTKVDKDLFFNETEGRATLANGTTRTGWAGNVRITGNFFDIAANLTLVRATFDDTGLAIPYAPRSIFRVDGVLFGDLPLKIRNKKIEGSFGAGVSYAGSRPLPFSEQSESQFLVDLAASAKWKALTLGITCTNLLDRQYRLGEYNYTSDFRSQGYPTLVASRHFTAGEPRAVFATFGVTFDSVGEK